MSLSPFNVGDVLTASEALHIAEDKIGDFFKFSSGQWKKHPFSVRTLEQLAENEIISDAFALLQKHTPSKESFDELEKDRDHYFICLQDHEILKALRRDKELSLLPLLVYVFTHELVHIVRFCNFMQRFEAKGKERDKEERIVHFMTYEILRRISMRNLDYVLDSYQNHRFCELALS
jgi:Mg2+ and Co2+ transporter CorA